MRIFSHLKITHWLFLFFFLPKSFNKIHVSGTQIACVLSGIISSLLHRCLPQSEKRGFSAIPAFTPYSKSCCFYPFVQVNTALPSEHVAVGLKLHFSSRKDDLPFVECPEVPTAVLEVVPREQQRHSVWPPKLTFVKMCTLIHVDVMPGTTVTFRIVLPCECSCLYLAATKLLIIGEVQFE